MALHQGDLLLGRQAVGVPQGAGVLGGGFPVRAQRGGTDGRCGRVLQHGGRVPGAVGMIRQHRQIVRGDRAGPHRRQYLPVHLQTAGGGHGIQHRQPGQLVAELGHLTMGAHDSAGHGLVESLLRVRQDGGQQGRRDPDTQDGQHVHHAARRGRQTRQAACHGLAHGGRNGLGRGGQDLRDDERVAGGDLIHLRGVHCVSGGQPGDGPAAQGGQIVAVHPRIAGQRSQKSGQVVGAADLVVAVGGQHQRRNARQTASQVAQQVHRGLIGPVDVLDDQQAGIGAQVGEQAVVDLVGPAGAGQRARQGGAHLLAQTREHVQQRAQGAGCGEGVAGADHDPDVGIGHLGQTVDDGGLADTGLAADQGQPSRATHGGLQVTGEAPEHGLSL